MKLLVFGASGSGTSTLGRSLSSQLGYSFLDADDFYWEKTEPPFSKKVPLMERNQRLMNAYHQSNDLIISGSLVTWGDFWQTAFNGVVFLYIPYEVRMNRLALREEERLGAALYTKPEVADRSNAFFEWASRYEDRSFEGRSIQQHEDWMELVDCPILELRSDLNDGERRQRVIEAFDL